MRLAADLQVGAVDPLELAGDARVRKVELAKVQQAHELTIIGVDLVGQPLVGEALEPVLDGVAMRRGERQPVALVTQQRSRQPSVLGVELRARLLVMRHDGCRQALSVSPVDPTGQRVEARHRIGKPEKLVHLALTRLHLLCVEGANLHRSGTSVQSARRGDFCVWRGFVGDDRLCALLWRIEPATAWLEVGKAHGYDNRRVRISRDPFGAFGRTQPGRIQG
jgi:hypothetical protein